MHRHKNCVIHIFAKYIENTFLSAALLVSDIASYEFNITVLKYIWNGYSDNVMRKAVVICGFTNFKDIYRRKMANCTDIWSIPEITAQLECHDYDL